MPKERPRPTKVYDRDEDDGSNSVKHRYAPLVIKEMDPWDLYVPPPGKDGNGERGCKESVYLSYAEIHKISKVIESGLFRFEVRGEVLRAAVVWFLEEICSENMDDNFKKDVKASKKLRQMILEKIRIDNDKKLAKVAVERINDLIDTDSRLAAKEWLAMERWFALHSAGTSRAQVLADWQKRKDVAAAREIANELRAELTKEIEDEEAE